MATLISTSLLQDTLIGIGRFVIALIPFVVLLVLIHRFIQIPPYIFRKLLHIIAFGSITALILSSSSWQACALVNIMFALLVWPILRLLESQSWYTGLFVEKHPGEIRSSLLMLFFTAAAVITIGWGWYGSRLAAASAILMWGIGDGFAAIIGIPFGKHKINLPHADQQKSIEGTLACLFASFLAGILIYFFSNSHIPTFRLFLCGIFGAIAELYSKNGNDTMIVPAVLIISMICLGL